MLASAISTLFTVVGWASAYQANSGPRDGPFWERRVNTQDVGRPVGGVPFRSPDLITNDLYRQGDSKTPGITLGGTPATAIPKHYNLTVEPDMQNATSFKGDVVMDFDIVEDSNTIFLHAQNLTFSRWAVMILFENGTELDLTGPKEVAIEQIPASQNLTLSLTGLGNETIPAGSSVKISISYEGVIWPNEEGYGVFQAPYTKADGTPAYYITTQGETSGMRRIFPCLDDPDLKANFTVSLIIDESLDGISNMAVAAETKAGGNKKKISFNTTPPMSSYLLAFAIGPLHYVQSDHYRLPVRIYATKDQDIKLSQWVADIAADGLKLYENSLGVKLALEKVDHVGVTGEPPMGGMENWGLITIGGSYFLLDIDDYDSDYRESIAALYLHELAHFWFGDTVTCAWWTEIWLNEGFADYLALWSTRHLFPEIDVIAEVPQSERQYAMEADIESDTHPIEIPLTKTGGYFDDISYSKGASLISMIEAYMGEEALLKGLNRYLTAHQLDNAVTADLWEALGDGAAEMWSPWTSNSGHPYLFVTETTGGIHLKQVRRTGSASDSADDVVFPVPLFLQTTGGVDKSTVMKDREQDIPVKDTDFFFINADGLGLYRVGYTSERLKKLATQTDKLSTGGIVGLITDTFQIAKEGSLSIVDVLQVAKGVMENDERYYPWYQTYDTLGTIRAMWQGNETIYNALQQLSLNQTLARIKRMGWPSDYWNLDGVKGDLEIRLRARTLAEAGLAGDKAAIEAGKKIFKTYLEKGKKAANGNLWKISGIIAVMHGGEEEFNALVAQLEKVLPNGTYPERTRLLNVLGRTQKPELVERALNFIIEKKLPSYFARYILDGIQANPAALGVAVNWTETHWADLINNTEAGPVYFLSRLIPAMTTRKEIDSVRAFIADPTRLQYQPAVNSALDDALKKVAWVERDSDKLKAWLASEVPVTAEAAKSAP